MTTDLTASQAPSTRSARFERPIRWLRVTTVLALVSGAALVADTVTIAVINRSFDPLDSVLFMVGFVGMLLTAGALALHLSRNRRGLRRVLTGVGSYLAVAVSLGALSFVFDQFGRHVFSPANQGLHGEWSFFSIGVALLLIGGWAARRREAAE